MAQGLLFQMPLRLRCYELCTLAGALLRSHAQRVDRRTYLSV